MRDLILRAKASPVYRMLLGRWVNQRHVKDQARLVNSLYKAAFGRLPEAEGLANRIHQLQSGESLEDLAEEFVVSPEFQTRHGTSQSVDTKYLMALYRDGLGLKPDLKYLAHWLAESKKGATRAKVLAAIAGSAEALEMSGPPKLDAIEPYSRWIALNDTISNSDRAAIGAPHCRDAFPSPDFSDDANRQCISVHSPRIVPLSYQAAISRLGVVHCHRCHYGASLDSNAS